MEYDVVVIGGGQAGLAVGYYLKKQKRPFLIVDEQNEAGDSWRKRYDSLVLFTPRCYSSLPGLAFSGDPNGYPTKGEMADYLWTYKETFQLPVAYKTKVERLEKKRDRFKVWTTSEGKTYDAKQVIIATGAFHTPFIPPLANSIHPRIAQLHASDYKGPEQIVAGPILIVGAGNTGVQIATELVEHHDVILACGNKPNVLPQSVFGKNLFWWFDRLGLSKATVNSVLGKWLQKRDTIIGNDFHTVRKRAKLKGRLINVTGSKAYFAEDSPVSVQTIIWATGYRNDYSWIDIDGVFDQEQKPIHVRGVTNVNGLFFVGLSWQYKRGSALVKGVGEDAAYIVSQLSKHS
ncbi:NAD(P)/FAD-dependent oxidoreductase [Shouchella clausii]